MVDQKCPICYNNHIQSKKESETSVIKSVPIEYLINARQEVRDAFPGRRIVARFRGPRRDSMALYCTKKNARTFAIYVD
jgi:hypothetical protein